MVQYDVKRVTKGAENFMVSFDFAKTPITQVADYIIIAAAKNKTSDIHFDPREEGMMVRFRIDGDCQDYTYIPKAYERNLTTRLKLLANMNITETRLPQDGAIKGQFGDTYLDMRVACLPTNQGEKIVIRILDYTRSLQGIDSLGFHPKNLEKIHHMMGVPNGIILVTGATGSGKSTTTYSMLSALNKPEVNVITVEDPVEMNIEGINQVQVNAEIGMTFAAALRSILREDPNVILIGEIRDSETAQIAVRASITGHLVMSTLHTNNALATVERLLDMDVERYLLSTALTGIISQRLAKQLCPDCRFQREPTKYEKKVYKKFLHQDVSLVWDANPKGCDNCRKGYKGRLAVHEVLLLDDKIRNALNDEKMSKDDFAKMIYSGNTISMLQDALIKSLEGQTSFEEVYKTIEIENEDEDNYQEELEGITIKQTTEEVVDETKTDEDFMGEETPQDSNLVAKYDIPGVTSASEPETPQEEQKAAEETQTVETPAEEATELQVTEAPPLEQQSEYANTEVTEETQTYEVPVEQQEQVVENATPETLEPTENQTEVNQTTAEQQPETGETQPDDYFAVETTPTKEIQTPIEETPQEPVDTEEVEDYFSVTTNPTAEQPQVEIETTEENNEPDEAVENYISSTPPTDNIEEQPTTEFVMPQVDGTPVEETTEVNESNETTTEFVMPQVDGTPAEETTEVNESNETTTEFVMPQVDGTPVEETTEVTESNETTTEFVMPQVDGTPIENTTEETQNEENSETPQENEPADLGYRIVMPDEDNQSDETPSDEENNNQSEEVETVPEEENSFEMPEVDSSPTSLDQLVEEVTDEDEEDTEEKEQEKYTVSATQEEKNNTNSDETDNASLAPIVDEDEEDEETEEGSEETQYQKNNTDYDEDPIDPTIDIKTDIDRLIMTDYNLEKLDMSNEDESTDKHTTDNQEETEENISEQTENSHVLEMSSGETPSANNEILDIPTGENTTSEQSNNYNEDDYEYDYEYDDYDFDQNDNDYTNEEQLFFNDQTSIDNNNINEDIVQNIQAISAVADVANTNTTEEHTGSSILTDPGIRIADDGSINPSANINADPILPNYED